MSRLFRLVVFYTIGKKTLSQKRIIRLERFELSGVYLYFVRVGHFAERIVCSDVIATAPPSWFPLMVVHKVGAGLHLAVGLALNLVNIIQQPNYQACLSEYPVQ